MHQAMMPRDCAELEGDNPPVKQRTNPLAMFTRQACHPSCSRAACPPAAFDCLPARGRQAARRPCRVLASKGFGPKTEVWGFS